MAEKIVQDGALLTEYPPGVSALPQHFPRRNRVISGLCHGVLVVEAAFKSGAMLTVSWALEQNRDVFAVPGSVLSEKSKGTNWLIQQGAKLTATADDILEELSIGSKPPVTGMSDSKVAAAAASHDPSRTADFIVNHPAILKVDAQILVNELAFDSKFAPPHLLNGLRNQAMIF